MLEKRITLTWFVFFLLKVETFAAPPNNDILLQHEQNLIVKTQSGYIRGRVSPTRSRDGREFYEWLGIPYAKPPIGLLRFASPEPSKSWVGIYDGTHYGPLCPQNVMYFKNMVLGQEDCLFLNIHAPKPERYALHALSLRILLFYIHGGAYLMGGSNTYKPNFLMDQNVIFVSFNYRLDILGFLSTGDEAIRGNMGLKDQVLALKWINQNIESFGGDPDRITIFGHSASGASAHLHLLSPMSKGLFARAISHSGAALNTWSLKSLEVSVKKSKSIGMQLGCPTSSSQLLAKCLRDASVADLMRTVWIDSNEFPGVRPNKFRNPTAPTIEAVEDEDAFLTEHPLDIVAQGKAHRVPWMVGHTADEGLLCMSQISVDNRALQELDSNVLKSIKTVFGLESKDANRTAGAIQDFYFPPSERSNLTRQKKLETYTRVFSDGYFNFDIRQSILYQRQFSAVYPYLFTMKDGPSVWSLTKQLFSGRVMDLVNFVQHTVINVVSQSVFNTELSQKTTGLGHAADALFIFPVEPLVHMSKKSKSYKFSKDYIQLIVDFASKNESELLMFSGVEFSPTPKKGQIKYFEITNNNPGVISQPFKDRMSFLENLHIHNISSTS